MRSLLLGCAGPLAFLGSIWLGAKTHHEIAIMTVGVVAMFALIGAAYRCQRLGVNRAYERRVERGAAAELARLEQLRFRLEQAGSGVEGRPIWRLIDFSNSPKGVVLLLNFDRDDLLAEMEWHGLSLEDKIGDPPRPRRQ